MLEVSKRKVIYLYYARIIKKKNISYDKLKFNILTSAISCAKTNKGKTKIFKNVFKEICEIRE